MSVATEPNRSVDAGALRAEAVDLEQRISALDSWSQHQRPPLEARLAEIREQLATAPTDPLAEREAELAAEIGSLTARRAVLSLDALNDETAERELSEVRQQLADCQVRAELLTLARDERSRREIEARQVTEAERQVQAEAEAERLAVKRDDVFVMFVRELDRFTGTIVDLVAAEDAATSAAVRAGQKAPPGIENLIVNLLTTHITTVAPSFVGSGLGDIRPFAPGRQRLQPLIDGVLNGPSSPAAPGASGALLREVDPAQHPSLEPRCTVCGLDEALRVQIEQGIAAGSLSYGAAAERSGASKSSWMRHVRRGHGGAVPHTADDEPEPDEDGDATA